MRKDSKTLINLDYEERLNLMQIQGNDANKVGKDVTLVTNSLLFQKKIELKQPYRLENQHITLITQGTAQYEINFDSNPYILKKGMLVLLPIGTMFITKSRSNDFNTKDIDFNIPQAETPDFFFYRLNILDLSPEDYSRIEKYFDLLSDSLNSKMQLNGSIEFIIMALLYDINTINIHASRRVNTTMSKSEQLFYRFMQLLLKSKEIERRPEYYSNELCISKSYMNDAIKKTSGNTTMYWIDRMSITLAKHLLLHTELSINDIAHNVGFKDQSAFARFFKSKENITPNEFKNNQE